MKQTVIILGAKRSQGRLENGQTYDSTKVYIQTEMNDSVDTVGFAVTEYNWGDSNNYYKIRDLPYPLTAEIEFDMVTNGKTTKLVVKSIEPVTSSKVTAKV